MSEIKLDQFKIGRFTKLPNILEKNFLAHKNQLGAGAELASDHFSGEHHYNFRSEFAWICAE